ncbi:MAG: thioredoxin [bacterium]
MSEVIFNDANFETEIMGDKPVLVDFFAPWCGPCKMQGPIIEELAKAIGDKAKVGKMNVDDNPLTAQKFNVMSVPTIIIFKNGNPAKTFNGLQSKENLTEEINKLI